MTEQEKIEKVRTLIRGTHICMLTTGSDDGSLHSRPMGVQEAEFDGDLWFFTSRTSRKYHELKSGSHANVSFCDLSANNFVSLTGAASFVEDKQKKKDLWKPILKTWFPEGVDDPNLALFTIKCSEAEYWDSPSGIGMALAYAKTLLTGSEAPLGENEKVRLS